MIINIEEALGVAYDSVATGTQVSPRYVEALLVYIRVLEAAVDGDDGLVAFIETLDILDDPSTMEAINEAREEKN